MIKLENGKHIDWTSKTGTTYHIYNINGKMKVFSNYVYNERKPTKEMKNNIQLV